MCRDGGERPAGQTGTEPSGLHEGPICGQPLQPLAQNETPTCGVAPRSVSDAAPHGSTCVPCAAPAAGRRSASSSSTSTAGAANASASASAARAALRWESAIAASTSPAGRHGGAAHPAMDANCESIEDQRHMSLQFVASTASTKVREAPTQPRASNDCRVAVLRCDEERRPSTTTGTSTGQWHGAPRGHAASPMVSQT